MIYIHYTHTIWHLYMCSDFTYLLFLNHDSLGLGLYPATWPPSLLNRVEYIPKISSDQPVLKEKNISAQTVFTFAHVQSQHQIH